MLELLDPSTAPTPTQESKSIAVGGTFNGALPANTVFTGAEWESSDIEKATVSADGIVTGIAAGTCTVTGYYKLPYKTAGIVYDVTVTAAAKLKTTTKK